MTTFTMELLERDYPMASLAIFLSDYPSTIPADRCILLLEASSVS
ncbi:MAG: hypothetical protein P8K79_11175 [Mariniblastus sp.]|nr:hypothetical protein [Mariniblastus sp.]